MLIGGVHLNRRYFICVRLAALLAHSANLLSRTDIRLVFFPKETWWLLRTAECLFHNLNFGQTGQNGYLYRLIRNQGSPRGIFVRNISTGLENLYFVLFINSQSCLGNYGFFKSSQRWIRTADQSHKKKGEREHSFKTSCCYRCLQRWLRWSNQLSSSERPESWIRSVKSLDTGYHRVAAQPPPGSF